MERRPSPSGRGCSPGSGHEACTRLPEGWHIGPLPAPLDLESLPSKAREVAEEWEEAKTLLPHVAAKVPPERMSAYWGKVSKDYDQVVLGDGLEESIVTLLRREGCLRLGDEVLDVGCGPGTYTGMFAEVAGKVTCLDYSSEMLQQLMAKHAQRGNVETVRADWGSYSGPGGFDLVFSSFCPDTNDWRSLLRMESLSLRSCCLVAPGDPRRESLQYRILDSIGWNSYSNQGYDVLYAFRFLYALGRCPSLRVYRTFVEIERTPERMVQGHLDYLELLMPVGERERRLVEERVRAAPWKEGRLREPRAVGALFWDVPREGAPGE